MLFNSILATVLATLTVVSGNPTPFDYSVESDLDTRQSCPPRNWRLKCQSTTACASACRNSYQAQRLCCTPSYSSVVGAGTANCYCGCNCPPR
ncbi:unnamed protein product [Cercospora beticola]|nr:unnamed protein product [Cercospora beticola]